jgi:hypothetical protein
LSISGYTTIFRGEEFQFPYKESIKSLLGCCDEVVVLVTLKDGIDVDGTLSNLEVMHGHDDRIKIHTQNWDKDDPFQDGKNKTIARSFCTGTHLIQADADEILHPKDFEFFTKVPELYPDATLISVGCLDFFNTRNQIIVDGVDNYKPRISKNLPWLSHGVPAEFVERNPRTEKSICPSMKSDGAGYINIETGEAVNPDIYLIDHKIAEFRKLAVNNHQIYLNDYVDIIEQTFNQLPYVFHYSCIDVKRKVKLQLRMWESMWNLFAGNIDEFNELEDVEYRLVREKIMHRLNNCVSAYIDVQHPDMAEEYLSRIGK